MDTPWNDHTEQTDQPIHFDVSPERLDAMSPAELAGELEQALDEMTEDTYDAAVIDAYLEALDRKTPMPEFPDSEAAYRRLQTTLQGAVFQTQDKAATSGTSAARRRGLLRIGLVAAITTACLFGGMVAAQAAGIDVFGTLARWTQSAFSFGDIQSGDPAQQANISGMPADLPAEYQELWSELEARGVSGFMFPTYIPDGFQFAGNELYASPDSSMVDFTAWYTKGDETILFNVLSAENLAAIYEKDTQDVEIYEIGNVEYYLFSNNERNIAVWHTGNVEYSISTALSISELKTIVNSIYQG